MLECEVPGQPVLHRAAGSATVHRVLRGGIGRVPRSRHAVLGFRQRSLPDGYDAVLLGGRHGGRTDARPRTRPRESRATVASTKLGALARAARRLEETLRPPHDSPGRWPPGEKTAHKATDVSPIPSPWRKFSPLPVEASGGAESPRTTNDRMRYMGRGGRLGAVVCESRGPAANTPPSNPRVKSASMSHLEITDLQKRCF